MNNEIKGLFTQKEISRFTGLRNGINVIFLTVLFSIPAAFIYFFSQFSSVAYTLIGIIIIGAVQHTLATFVHEAAHFNLFSHRRMNDFFGHFLCASPLISYMKDYRYFHFEHHRHTGKAGKDPELDLYRAMNIKNSYTSRKEVMRVFLHDFTGVSFLKSLKFLIAYFGDKRKKGLLEQPSSADHLSVAFWFIVIPAVMWLSGLLLPWFLFWVVPLFTITPVLLRWHGFGEHIREKNSCLSENTFTHRFSLLPTLFLYPINSSFHLEHHLYPQIPWYSLKKFREWADAHPIYASHSSKLVVNGFFIGEQTVARSAFPIEK